MSNFGQILKEVGEFGLFQKWLLAALCIPCIFSAFNVIGQIFTGMDFPHHCNTDWILERGPNLTEERQKNLTIPVDEDGNYESCRMFTPVDWDLETIEAYGINSTTECIDGWDYEAPKGASSFASEFNAVCHQSGLVELSQSIFMIGVLFGSLTFGSISDRFGRRFAMLFALCVMLIFGLLNAFAPSIYVFMAFNFFCGFVSIVVMCSTVMAMEWTGPSKVALCTDVILIFYAVGLMILSGIAYLIRNWRILQLVLYCPIALVLGIFYWLLPESPRWLMTRGRKEEAIKELRRAARINGRTVTDDQLEKLEIEGTSGGSNMLDIFRIPYLRKRTFILGFIWFSTGLLYYGLSLNVGSFGTNIYLTQFTFGFAEIPANLGGLFLIQRFGRRICQAGFLFFGGACLLILAIPIDIQEVVTTIAVLGMFSAAASFGTAYVYTAELYPTVLRQNGGGINSMCARVAGIISPLIRLLEVYHPSVPMLVYGIPSVVAGGLCFLLPETLNAELQDHTEQKKPVNEPTWNKENDAEHINEKYKL